MEMPIELGIWRIDQGLSAVPTQAMDTEKRLEDLLERDIGIIGPHLMVIGRQVPTSFGKLVDLLAIDAAGNLAVIELKKDLTPREVVAQVLDYGSWIHELQAEAIGAIWQEYLGRNQPEKKGLSFDQAFCQRFNTKAVPEELNSEHELIVVASALDESTERIVKYLADYHEVGINAIFFRLFRDGDREYLTRVWLRDPTAVATDGAAESPKGTWNHEYYVSFGGGRDWDEAVKHGFIAGGGGEWYSNTLLMLSPGDRVWVNSPGRGYVGVGKVVEPRVPAAQFLTSGEGGARVPITALPLLIAQQANTHPDPESTEYLVRVQWLKTVPEAEAIKEVGFFGNQNTVARPRTQKWAHTVERLKQRFGIE
jgi:hypothetical protein